MLPTKVMTTINIKKTEKYTRTVGSGETAKQSEEEREVTVYEQKVSDDKIDLQAVIATINQLEKPQPQQK